MKAEPEADWRTLAVILIPATVAAFLIVAAVVWATCFCTLGQLPELGNGG